VRQPLGGVTPIGWMPSGVGKHITRPVPSTMLEQDQGASATKRHAVASVRHQALRWRPEPTRRIAKRRFKGRFEETRGGLVAVPATVRRFCRY
jgi:hypothetical protein